MTCIVFSTLVYPTGLDLLSVLRTSRTEHGPACHKTPRISSSARVGLGRAAAIPIAVALTKTAVIVNEDFRHWERRPGKPCVSMPRRHDENFSSSSRLRAVVAVY